MEETLQVLYDDCNIYNILGTEIRMYSDDTAYGWNVIADINGEYQYLGDDLVCIELAIWIWQIKYSRVLNDSDLAKIMKDNNILT